MFESLKITAYPRCGIESDVYLPLDGILFAQAMANYYGPLPMSTPGEMAEVLAVDLPIEKRCANGQWFYAASFAQWGQRADGSTFWTKRFDRKTDHLIDFGNSRGKVITEQGRYKAYMMPVFYRHALDVSWYVYGDGGEISALLAGVTHIGKKVAQGEGRINRWQVERVAQDLSVYDSNNQPMRSIPARSGVLYGVRPSYWYAKNQTTCILPSIPLSN